MVEEPRVGRRRCLMLIHRRAILSCSGGDMVLARGGRGV